MRKKRPLLGTVADDQAPVGHRDDPVEVVVAVHGDLRGDGDGLRGAVARGDLLRGEAPQHRPDAVGDVHVAGADHGEVDDTALFGPVSKVPVRCPEPTRSYTRICPSTPPAM